MQERVKKLQTLRSLWLQHQETHNIKLELLSRQCNHNLRRFKIYFWNLLNITILFGFYATFPPINFESLLLLHIPIALTVPGITKNKRSIVKWQLHNQ